MNRHPFTPYMASLIALLLFSGIPLVSADGPWKQAAPGYQFSFPRDHGSHPDYRIEWWYYTGNLSSRDGQHFGYQLTFFRFGIDPRPSNPSKWAVRDLHMAHFAITDISANSFHYFEKLNREGIG